MAHGARLVSQLRHEHEIRPGSPAERLVIAGVRKSLRTKMRLRMGNDHLCFKLGVISNASAPTAATPPTR